MINFKRSFNSDKLKKLTTNDCGIAILQNTVDDAILQNELVDLVSSNVGISKDSTNGTMFGNDLNPPPWKLMGRPEFIKSWAVCRYPNGQKWFARIGSKKDDINARVKSTYDTEGKQLAREEGPEWCLRKIKSKEPNILTFAGPKGYDVKRLLEINPRSIIDNVEYNPNVYNSIIKQDLPMTTHFSKLVPFLEKNPQRFFDLFNFDSDGYISEELDKALKLIDKNRSMRYVCLTIQNNKKIRNHGTFAENLRKKYEGYDDPSLEYINNDVMFNYDIIKDFIYNRDDGNSMGMWTIIFKLKES